MSWVWESIILVISGVFLLRIAGRKSISQMTLAQTVVMISIGSIIIQPIIETRMWRTIWVSAIFVGVLIIMEYLQIKSNAIEKFITGKSKIIIQNGQIDTTQLRKLRITVDQLEMRLRQQGISRVTDVNYATLEPNGQIGYQLMPDARPLTVGEFKKLMNAYMQGVQQPVTDNQNNQHPDNFEEILKGVQQKNPEKLR